MAKNKLMFLTPGLERLRDEFEIHCEIAEDKPILITGPSGVGKSLFLHFYIEREIKEGRRKPQIIDCSMLVGEDPNIAKSELFGHDKGAFTGADKSKIGLIEQAAKNNTALIFDEIGELPMNVQAMLLIFIETGKYRRVGSIEDRKGKTRILAATNKAENLRQELRYRFFSFNIPGLHARREDILEYFAFLFKDVFVKLNFYENLALLSYNWPGNVREIEQVGMLLRRFKKANSLFKDIDAAGILHVDDKSISQFDAFNGYRFYRMMEEAGIDMKIIDRLLYNSGVGFFLIPKLDTELCCSAPFSISSDAMLEKDKDVLISQEHLEMIENISSSFRFLCEILSLDVSLDSDLLAQEKWKYNEFCHGVARQYFEIGKVSSISKEEFERILGQVKNYLLSSDDCKNHLPLENYTFKEIQKKYFSVILEKSGGNKTEAARLAGIPRSTMINKLNKLGLS